jgi:hypothetical protein
MLNFQYFNFFCREHPDVNLKAWYPPSYIFDRSKQAKQRGRPAKKKKSVGKKVGSDESFHAPATTAETTAVNASLTLPITTVIQTPAQSVPVATVASTSATIPPDPNVSCVISTAQTISTPSVTNPITSTPIQSTATVSSVVAPVPAVSKSGKKKL